MDPNTLPPIEPATTTVTQTVKVDHSKRLVIMWSIAIIILLVIISALLFLYVQANSPKSSSDNLSSSSSSESSLSSASTSSSSTVSSSLQTFNLKTKPLGSDTYSDKTIDITLSLPNSFVIGQRDESGISLQNGSMYLTFETSAEESGGLYEQKKTVTNLTNAQLGNVYRIVSTSQLSHDSLKSRFQAEGNNLYYYTTSYSETGCGPVFDSSTGKTSPAKACGGTTLSYKENGNFQLLSVHCITSETSDVAICDQLVEGMILAIK